MIQTRFTWLLGFCLGLGLVLYGFMGMTIDYAYTLLPGTFMHEGLHYLMALAVGSHPHDFTLKPILVNHRLILGHVNLVPDNINAAAVGWAPIILLPLSFLFVALASRSENLLRQIILCWFAMSGFVTFSPSPEDLHFAAEHPWSWPLGLVLVSLISISLGAITYRILKRETKWKPSGSLRVLSV